MLTPQEIQDKKFEKAVFGGYDMNQIDEFLDALLADYSSLYKENVTLKAKMKVLVDKIEEYRAVDEEMRKALYMAQVSAKDILTKAQTEADAMVRDARKTAEAEISDMRRGIEEERARLQQAREETQDYAAQIRGLFEQGLGLADHIAGLVGGAEADPAPQQWDPPAQEELAYAAQRQAPAMDYGDTTKVMPDFSRAEGGERAPMHLREEPAPEPQVSEPPRREPAKVVRTEDMETKYYEIELGDKLDELDRGRKRRRKEDEESDTAKIYGSDELTPKPRFTFGDLRFGKDYQEEHDGKK